jgi:transglutaminase-like putative cysteine protease
MRALALQGAQQIRVRNKAVQLTSGLLQKDYAGEACACLAYCRDGIRYVRDIFDVETLHAATTVMDIGAGDCDDKAILLAALLLSIGHPGVRFIALSLEPGQFCHVWVQDYVEGGWLDLEPTEAIPCGGRVPDAGALEYLTCKVSA